MKFSKQKSLLFVPDGADEKTALGRTTHMAIAAHQDDVEIMAFHGVKETFMKTDAYFTALIATDGAGSARDGRYASYTDEQMQAVRYEEQKKAAVVGDYGALVMLGFSSGEIKNPADKGFETDLIAVLKEAKPKIVYTHNLADKHDSHCGVAVKTIKALRALPDADKPEKVYGCEVWRGLDWLCDESKTAFDLSGYDSLSAAVLGVFDSQIAGGKRYDLATEGRRKANATYFASHAVDSADKLTFALDLTPLIHNDADIVGFITGYIDEFKNDVINRLGKVL